MVLLADYSHRHPLSPLRRLPPPSISLLYLGLPFAAALLNLYSFHTIVKVSLRAKISVLLVRSQGHRLKKDPVFSFVQMAMAGVFAPAVQRPSVAKVCINALMVEIAA